MSSKLFILWAYYLLHHIVWWLVVFISEECRSEVVQRVKEERNDVHTVKRRKSIWVGHILRGNCVIKYVIEGKIYGGVEVTGRRRRRKHLLDYVQEIG